MRLLGSNQADRDEQFQIQQEMLARRRNPKAKEANFAAVEKRREEVARQMSKTLWAKNTKKSEDPLEEWKEALKRGDVKDLGYEAEPPKSSSLFGINIPLPMSPIDVPKYDNGERFDLRLPYAERYITLVCMLMFRCLYVYICMHDYHRNGSP